MLIYADLAIGIPIALFAVTLLVVSFYSNRAYLLSAGAYESHMLHLYDSSQQIVVALGLLRANYTAAVNISMTLSAEYNISVSIIPYNGYGYCPLDSVCRTVPLPRNMYTMVFT